MRVASGLLRPRGLVAALAVGVLSLSALAPVASADQTFHTARIPLLPVNGAPLQSGAVVDVHANGPVIYAQERYLLVGAAPDTTYHVQIAAYLPSDTACTTPLEVIPEATLTTNPAGNGEAGFTFAPSQAPPAGILNLQWTVLAGGAVVYQTACTPVALD